MSTWTMVKATLPCWFIVALSLSWQPPHKQMNKVWLSPFPSRLNPTQQRVGHPSCLHRNCHALNTAHLLWAWTLPSWADVSLALPEGPTAWNHQWLWCRGANNGCILQHCVSLVTWPKDAWVAKPSAELTGVLTVAEARTARHTKRHIVRAA